MSGPAVALIGDPVGGSVSPSMHRAAFAESGLDWTYEAVTVRSGELAATMPALLLRFVGLNVTRPLKEEIIPILDRIDPAAARAGSVNTVAVTLEGSVGLSTDGPGFLAALRRAGIETVARAVLLGTGGAARAVAAVLLREESEVIVAGRNQAAGHRLVTDVERDLRGVPRVAFVPSHDATFAAAVAGADLLVNATPVGGWPETGASALPDSVTLRPGMAVMDLVYRPRRTTLLARAAAAGCRVVEGIEMLIEQGARSFEIWTGRPAPVEAMRDAAYRALELEPAAWLGAP